MKNAFKLLVFALAMLLLAGLFSCKKNKPQNKTTSSVYDFTCNYYLLQANQTTWQYDTVLFSSIYIFNSAVTAQQYEDSNQSTSLTSWFVDCN